MVLVVPLSVLSERDPCEGIVVVMDRNAVAEYRRSLLFGEGVVVADGVVREPVLGPRVVCGSPDEWYERVGVAIGDPGDSRVFVFRGLLSWAGDRAAARAGDVPGVVW